jgi:hypothetical protein
MMSFRGILSRGKSMVYGTAALTFLIVVDILNAASPAYEAYIPWLELAAVAYITVTARGE